MGPDKFATSQNSRAVIRDRFYPEAKRNGLDSLYKEKMKREEKMTKSTTEMKADLGQFSDTLNQMSIRSVLYDPEKGRYVCMGKSRLYRR